MAVTRFWVGGTNSFGNTSAWATTSGGTPGASVPGSADTAIIDALSGGGTYTINGNPTVLSFSFVNVNKTDALSLSGSLTIAAGGALSLTGNSVTNRGFIKSSILGTQRSISVPSGATVTVTNADFQDINMTGTFSTGATTSSIGDALGNTFGWSSVQPDVSVAQTLTGTGTINWSTAANWTSRVPLPQDDVSLGSSSTATTLTADMPRMGRNIDSSVYLKTLSFASTPNTIYGNITLGSGATYSGTQALTLQGRGAQTITSNTKAFPQAITVAAFGGTYTQQDNFTAPSNQNFTHTNGTWDSQSFSLTVGAYIGNATIAKVLKATSASVWNMVTTGSSTVWAASTTQSDLTNFLATIKVAGTNAGSQTFTGAGLTYGTLNWSSTASTGTLIITGANTFAALQSDNTTARTWQFPNGVTQTIQPGGWQINGKPGVNITINSSSAGSQATISMAGGHVVASNIIIKDSNAIGGAQWYAGASSIYNGDVTGWIFRNPAATRHAGRQLYN